MTTITSITRVLILLALGFIAIVGIFSEPLPESPDWYTDLILSKTLGALSAWAVARLLARWRHDPAVKALLGPRIDW